MTGAADPAGFLERFRRFGAAASVESYRALFHPEAALYDEGMERPIGVSEIPAHIAGVLALIQGFRMQVERWRARGATVFVEAHNAGELQGEPVAWRAVYRIELEGSLVRNGRRYFDRAPLLARLDPATPSLAEALALRAEPLAPGGPARAASAATPAELVEHCARCWRDGRPEDVAEIFREDAALCVAGLGRAFAGAELRAFQRRFFQLLSGVRLTPRSWAGDDSLLFIEWQGTLPAPGGAHALGLVERFDLLGGRVLAARSYFESAALARVLRVPLRAAAGA